MSARKEDEALQWDPQVVEIIARRAVALGIPPHEVVGLAVACFEECGGQWLFDRGLADEDEDCPGCPDCSPEVEANTKAMN